MDRMTTGGSFALQTIIVSIRQTNFSRLTNHLPYCPASITVVLLLLPGLLNDFSLTVPVTG